MPESLRLDYLVEARSALDSYIEGLMEPRGGDDPTLLTEAVAFSLMSIADSLATIAGSGGGS